VGKSQTSNSTLHYTIIKHVIEKGYAPNLSALMELLQADRDSVVSGLKQLEADHGVVLHPDSSDIWVIHPFSLSPTNFWVQSDTGSWWGNCAWCSLGIAALLKRDVTITTSIGAQGDRVDAHIEDGRVIEDHLLVHFPIPMQNA
jgi:hypothetical protein